MQCPIGLGQHLEALSASLDDPGTDLHAILDVLTDDVVAAVPSFLGLIMTVYFGDRAITVSTVDSASAASSVLLPLPALAGVSRCNLVLYAADSGAFGDLAADLRSATGDGQLIVDGHLPLPTSRLYPGDAVGINQLSQIDQAVGVLMDAGHTPAGARHLLQNRADRHGISLAASAQRELRHLS